MKILFASIFGITFLNNAFALPNQSQMNEKLWRELDNAVKIERSTEEDLAALKENLKAPYSDEISLSQAAIKRKELPSNKTQQVKRNSDSNYFHKESNYKKARVRSR